jgi:sortase B
MKKTICMILLLALSVVFAVSAYFYISEYLQDKEQLDELESIAQTVNDNEQNSDNKYAELYAQNSDFIGWLRIDGTGIDYPIMQSKDDPDFYLKHNFSKEYSRFGIPYMQENCGLSSDNIIIYGHNIKSKSMFNELTEYKNKAFYTAHKYITFDTLDEQRTYEVIATFKTVAYSDSGFQYYDFVNANTAEEFDDYVAKSRALSFYDTGVAAEYGDKLLTLSTCEYSQKNGRLAVVAKLIEVR